MLQKSVIALISAFALFSSCETFNAEIQPASYLYVSEFEFDNSGIDDKWQIKSSNVTDVWLYLDESQFLGAYELPAVIPLAVDGKHRISLRAGIKNAGISTERALYPFYAEFQMNNFNLRQNTVDTIKPITKYDFDSGDLQDAWYENFETLFSSWEHHPSSDTSIQFVGDDQLVFDGNFSAGIFLDEEDLFFEMNSTPPYSNLPKNGVPIYLELNYKTNHEFVIGLYANNKTEQIPIYVVKEKEEWNKIYLDFTDYVQSNSDAFNFNVFIGINKAADEGPVSLYLDNIKFIHY
ncbi:MAG: hypothetical protein RIC15_03000 [Vicingaceae bacterium]